MVCGAGLAELSYCTCILRTKKAHIYVILKHSWMCEQRDSWRCDNRDPEFDFIPISILHAYIPGETEWAYIVHQLLRPNLLLIWELSILISRIFLGSSLFYLYQWSVSTVSTPYIKWFRRYSYIFFCILSTWRKYFCFYC